jgi:chromosomal replication initiation ATPase DnaA
MIDDTFIETKNYRQLCDTIESLKSLKPGTPSLAVVHGRVGLGKTWGLYRYVVQNPTTTAYIYVKAGMTLLALLNEICYQLQEPPTHRTEKSFNNAVRAIIKSQTILFLDEADRLARNWKLIERMRDLNCLTNIPIVFIWTGDPYGGHKSLARYPQVNDRIAKFFEFQPLDKTEIIRVAHQYTQININEAIAEYIISKTRGDFRKVIVTLNRIKELTIVNPQAKVDLSLIKRAG